MSEFGYDITATDNQVELGHAICTLLSAGESMRDVKLRMAAAVEAAPVEAKDVVLTSLSATAVAGVRVFCPEHELVL